MYFVRRPYNKAMNSVRDEKAGGNCPRSKVMPVDKILTHILIVNPKKEI